MVLWLVDRVQFLRFTVALLAMSFVAFVVFLLVPVAPPWLAGHHHLLPGVHSLISLPSAVSPYYNWLNPDAAAAFPSLHYLGQHYVTDVLGGIVFALGAWLVMAQILVPIIPSLQHRPITAAPAGIEPGPIEPSSTDLDTGRPAGTQERVMPLGPG